MRWPVGVLFALVAVWLILFTPWKETIPPLEEPVDTMYVYGDVRLKSVSKSEKA